VLTKYWHSSFTLVIRIALGCLLVGIQTGFVLGQGHTTGRIAGTVKDENGAVIVGAEIRVTSISTGQEREAATGSEGHYSIPLLTPGLYLVKIGARISTHGSSIRCKWTLPRRLISMRS
jgi:hypothetical protein